MRLGENYVKNSIMGSNNRKLNKAIKQLSSGKTINSASDNASGLAISEKMKAQIRGLERASRNSEEAISFIQTADSVMGSITENLHRMKELSVQSANGINDNFDRRALEEEFKNIQNEIDEMITNTEFNGINIFENHEDTYFTIEGNNKFEADKTLSVISGLSDNLVISIDGKEIEVIVPEGKYTTQELADKIDDILFDKYIDTGINLEYSTDKTFNLNYENGKNIDYVSGGLSYLIYGSEKGTQEGIVIGTTIFNEGEKLIVDRNQNDTLSFYLGSKNDPITIVLDQGKYSRNEIIEAINKKLDEIGENTVRASAYGEKFIALSDEKYVVTGLKGNMFKIDYGDRIYSSVFYDNTNYGSIEKTNASITSGMQYGNSYDGSVSIKTGINDTLKFTLDGANTYEIKLDAGSYTAKEMANKLNEIFLRDNIEMKASDSSNRLVLKSNLSGSESAISFDTSDVVNKNTYESLFAKYGKTDELEVKDGGASLTGYKTIYQANNVTITDKNNVIKFNIKDSSGTSSIEIKLDNGTYTGSVLMDKLKEALKAEPRINVDFKSNNICFTALDRDITQISFDEVSNSAYETLFRAKYNYSMYDINQGTSTSIQGSTTTIEAPAEAIGNKVIGFPVTFTSENNQLSYNINGIYKTINIAAKTYNSRNELLTELNKQMKTGESSGVSASFDSLGRLTFTSEAKGSKATLNSFSGTALEVINGSYMYREISGASNAKIDGKLGVASEIEIDSTNNVLNFQYKKAGEDSYKDYSITLKEGKYNASALQTELNNALAGAGLESYIMATVSTSNDYSYYHTDTYGIDFTSKEALGAFSDKISGTFLDVINKRENKATPWDSNTGNYIYDEEVKGSYKEVQNAFIVGREDIKGKDIEISSGINDNLIFDFKMPDDSGSSKSYTIELNLSEGTYNNTSLINEIQGKLNEKLKEFGLDEDLIKAQIGGVSTGMANDSNMFVLKYNGKEENNKVGNYLIDGVRGTAAYTIFYKKEENIHPASVTGTRELGYPIEVKGGKTELSIEVDSIKYDISLKEGTYTEDSFLEMLNESIKNATSDKAEAVLPMPIVATIEKGNLKFTYKTLGFHTIDKIQGLGKNIFFDEMGRDENVDLAIQIGANAGQNLSLDKVAISTALLKINTLTIEKTQNAEKANKRLEFALEKLNGFRGKYGAVQNRLEHVINIDNNSSENLQAAESKIRDTDMAKAMTEFSKLNILNQVSLSLMSQSKELNSQFAQNILR